MVENDLARSQLDSISPQPNNPHESSVYRTDLVHKRALDTRG